MQTQLQMVLSALLSAFLRYNLPLLLVLLLSALLCLRERAEPLLLRAWYEDT